jgi:hypothetical protein
LELPAEKDNFGHSNFMSHSAYAILIIILLFTACGQKEPAKYLRRVPSFEKVMGIPYTEVRRNFDTGLSFNEHGYQLEPEWKMRFLSKDSVRLFNPPENRSYNFYVHYDHDSVINMARVWMRVKTVSPDSLIMQLLEVHGRRISGEGSNVYMTFYADRYINDVLETSAEKLKKPSQRDSTFIRKKTRASGNKPELAFPAREPAKILANSRAITVEKIVPEKDVLNSTWLSSEYMSPEYDIMIKPSYRDFNYSFTVVVDTAGKLHFGKSTVYIMPEFEESRIKVMKGIVDVYLQNLLKITPGKTLGIAHPSEITLHVKGIK